MPIRRQWRHITGGEREFGGRVGEVDLSSKNFDRVQFFLKPSFPFYFLGCTPGKMAGKSPKRSIGDWEVKNTFCRHPITHHRRCDWTKCPTSVAACYNVMGDRIGQSVYSSSWYLLNSHHCLKLGTVLPTILAYIHSRAAAPCLSHSFFSTLLSKMAKKLVCFLFVTLQNTMLCGSTI